MIFVYMVGRMRARKSQIKAIYKTVKSKIEIEK